MIQELEAFFRGAGWNVIKVIWGREWDPLLAADTDGALVNLMNATPDGDYQTYKAESGAYVREHFFGRDPRTRKMVEHLTDDEIWNLKRGGHDYRKLYAAYKAATEHTGQPTVILAKTIKGWTLGSQLRGPQRHAPDEEADPGRPQGVPRPALPRHPGLGARGRPVPAAVLPRRATTPTRCSYMRERRDALGGSLPSRRTTTHPAAPSRRPRRSATSSAAPASRRWPPRWPSSGCSRT